MEASITVFLQIQKNIFTFYLDGGEYAQWCLVHTFLRSVIINPILHTVCLDGKNYAAR